LSDKGRWLFRTLHAAELAGLDPAEVIDTAITSRDLAGSRDIAAVLDARIRQRVHPLLPQPQGPWAERVPDLPVPDRHAYLSEIATLMDDRTRRLGHYITQTAPSWAVTALGPVPSDPVGRRQWEHQASAIAAYREMYGYDYPGDPIGPEPSRETPDKRTAWHGAFTAALSPTDGTDVRTIPDGRLWLIRDTYTAETAWAPRHVSKELRLSQLGALDAGLGAIRADAEAAAARKADDHARAERHETIAASYRALRDHYQQREHTFVEAMADRQEWEHATEESRHLAIAADAELRRRHPHQKIEPLRSAEQGPVSDNQREHLPQALQGELTEAATWIRDLATQHQAFQARTDKRRRRVAHNEDLDWAGLGETSRSPRAPYHDATLQPPKPQITLSATIPRLALERDADHEAAD
jgi:hypothetical protein